MAKIYMSRSERGRSNTEVYGRCCAVITRKAGGKKLKGRCTISAAADGLCTIHLLMSLSDKKVKRVDKDD